MELAKLILHKVETGVVSPYKFQMKKGGDQINSAGETVGLGDKKTDSDVDKQKKFCC